MLYRFSETEGVIQNGSNSPETTLSTHTSQIAALQSATSSVPYTAAGAISPTGVAVLQGGKVLAMTLVAPPAGATLTIVAADAWAYTVTCPANTINGNADTMTWTAAAGNCIVLASSGGVWYSYSATGVTLSEV